MAWGQVGNIRGPQGPQGAAGAKGDPGERGADGTGIQIAGNVANYAALPSNLGLADAGKGYLNDADGKLYIWSGTAFPANGAGTNFQGPPGATGPKGDQGDQGIQGIQGIQGVKGDTGNTGADGAPGAKGDKGDTGAAGAAGTNGTNGTKWFTGTGAPGTIAGATIGDKYLDTSDGTVYELT